MAHDVFISYSTRNSQTANAVCHVLEQNGIRCWMAPRDITVGAEYVDCIDQAIINCKLCVLIFSAPAQESRWVKSEIMTAFETSKPILPFRVENIQLQGTMRVVLNDKHWLEAYPYPEEKFSSLVDTAKEMLHSVNSTQDTLLNVNVPTARRKRKFSIFSSVPEYTLRLVCNCNSDVYVDGKHRAKALDERVCIVKTKEENCTLEVVSNEYKKVSVVKIINSLLQGNTVLCFDVAKAELDYLMTTIDEKNDDAWNDIGIKLLDDKRYDDALRWFLKASKNDNTAACYNLGMMYHFGKGVEVDYPTAIEFYERAIESNYPLALNNLGSFYYNGQGGLEKDMAKAFELFYKAAEQSLPQAQLSVAMMLFYGEGVEENRTEAKLWFEKAAAQGVGRAQIFLNSWVDDHKI